MFYKEVERSILAQDKVQYLLRFLSYLGVSHFVLCKDNTFYMNGSQGRRINCVPDKWKNDGRRANGNCDITGGGAFL